MPLIRLSVAAAAVGVLTASGAEVITGRVINGSSAAINRLKLFKVYSNSKVVFKD